MSLYRFNAERGRYALPDATELSPDPTELRKLVTIAHAEVQRTGMPGSSVVLSYGFTLLRPPHQHQMAAVPHHFTTRPNEPTNGLIEAWLQGVGAQLVLEGRVPLWAVLSSPSAIERDGDSARWALATMGMSYRGHSLIACTDSTPPRAVVHVLPGSEAQVTTTKTGGELTSPLVFFFAPARASWPALNAN